jgi:hypothetical protein
VASFDSDLFFVISLNSKKKKPCFLKASVTLTRSFVGHSINFAFVATDAGQNIHYGLEAGGLRGHIPNMLVPCFMTFFYLPNEVPFCMERSPIPVTVSRSLHPVGISDVTDL